MQKVYFLHSRGVNSDGQRDRLKAMQEPLQESKCENCAVATGSCMKIVADAQLSSFEGLGKNSLVEKAPALFTRVSGAFDGGNSRQNDERAQKRKHGRG